MSWVRRLFFMSCIFGTTVSYINRAFFKEDLRDTSKIFASSTMTTMFAFDRMPDPLADHELIFALHQRNLDRLDEILESVSTPEQPGYGQYLTRDQVALLTAPSSESIANVETFLKSFGVHESKQRKTLYGEFIIATAPVIVWEAMFQTVFYELTPQKKDSTKHASSSSSSSSSSKNKKPIETAIRAKHISLPEPLREHVLAVLNTVQLPIFSSSLAPRGVISEKQAIPRAMVEAMSLGQGLVRGQEEGQGSAPVQEEESKKGFGQDSEQEQGRLLMEQEPVPLTGYTYPKLLEDVSVLYPFCTNGSVVLLTIRSYRYHPSLSTHTHPVIHS